MSTLTLMPAAGPRAPIILAPSNRRLAGGLLVSLLLHAVLLSLHFGIPGLRPGTGRPLSVVLAPAGPSILTPAAELPAPVRPPIPLPGAALAPEVQATPPVQETPMAGAGQPAPAPHRGFTLGDPAPALPAPPAPRPAPPVRRPLRRRARPRHVASKETLHTEVMARQASEDPSFVLPQPDTPVTAEAPELAQQADEQDAAALAAEEAAARARADAEARQREAEEARRLAEQQAEQQAGQRRAEQRRADELARQKLAEQQAEQQRAQQLAEQQRADELARQRLAEQQRTQQLAEQRRMDELARQQLAEQQRAQQLAEQKRAEELARRRLAEQQRAQQLADQREAEARAQQAAARQRADELVRQQAEEAARRLARQEDTPGQPAAEPGGNPVRAERGEGPGTGQGAGGGVGGGSRLPGSDFGSRARELLRGIDIANAVPPAIRAAEQAQQAVRRALADAARRDVPLRMYIDSVRQKIERNAIVGAIQLSSQTVHTDPVVSIAIRSDGSIEDVTILRSSGRPDIDEIVRRIVRLNARYAAFPANVAANYDVIELRRIWTFAGVLRLVEEVR